jgi:LPLT family lysophospholipid transporter-like MFS transporter
MAGDVHQQRHQDLRLQLMFFDVHPLLAYAVVGLGAAAYSPAKYGILTEYLPHRLLVVANGWIEGLTVGAIILGVVLGGALIKPEIAHGLLSLDFPVIDTGIDTVAEMNLVIIGTLYLIAAAVQSLRAGHRRRPQAAEEESGLPAARVQPLPQAAVARQAGPDFAGGHHPVLGRRRHAAIHRAGMGPVAQPGPVQGQHAAGRGRHRRGHRRGAAAKMITLRKSVRVIPLGIAMGSRRDAMIVVRDIWLAAPLLVLIGMALRILRGADECLLQHRGHILMGAGHSIAVQNFNENLSILIMTTGYSLLIKANLVDLLDHRPCSACSSPARCGWSSAPRGQPAPARRRRPPGRRRPPLSRASPPGHSAALQLRMVAA